MSLNRFRCCQFLQRVKLFGERYLVEEAVHRTVAISAEPDTLVELLATVGFFKAWPRMNFSRNQMVEG